MSFQFRINLLALLFSFFATSSLYTFSATNNLLQWEASVSTSNQASSANFAGGVTADNGNSLAKTFDASQKLDVLAYIYPASEHVGKTGSLYVIAHYNDGWYMKTSNGQWQKWDLQFANLVANTEPHTLQAIESPVVALQLSGLEGKFDVYVGYKVDNDIYYNAQSFNFTVNPTSLNPQTILLSPNAQYSVLSVKGRFLTDANGNNVMLRGFNVPAYKEGWQDDIAAVANAVASTKANAVRLLWWTHIAGTPEPQIDPASNKEAPYYTALDLDRAIDTFAKKGILSIVTLHDLIGQADSTQFANIITAFWTRPDIVAVLKKHQSHLIINIANEWGPNWNTNQNIDSAQDVSNFIDTYKAAITAIRAQGINVPLMINADHYADNEQIFTSKSYGQAVSNGQVLINADPQQNLLFSVHTYFWEFNYNTNTPADATIAQSRIANLVNSNLPFFISEMGNVLPDCSAVSGYADLLTQANNNKIGYFAWGWYNDGSPGNDNPCTMSPDHRMNITLNGNSVGDGVTLPTNRSQNTWGWDALYGTGFGINAAQPATQLITFPTGNPPPSNLFPKVTSQSVNSREYNSISAGSFYFPWCTYINVPNGKAIDLTQSGCSFFSILNNTKAPSRYFAAVTVENPTNEVLIYDWNLLVTKSDGTEQSLYTGGNASNSTTFDLPDYLFVGLVTQPCRITVKVNAPDPARSKGPLTVWTGQCTYHATIIFWPGILGAGF